MEFIINIRLSRSQRLHFQLTQLIADKEKKSSSYKESKLDALSDEKVAKIKKFAKEYIGKVLRKMEKSGEKRKASSSSSTTTAVTQAPSSISNDTPNPHGDGDIVMGDTPVEPHEAMDLGGDSDSDMGDEDEGHEDHGSPSAPPPDEAMDGWQDTPQRQNANGWNSQNRAENGGSPNGFGADGGTLSVAS